MGLLGIKWLSVDRSGCQTIDFGLVGLPGDPISLEREWITFRRALRDRLEFLLPTLSLADLFDEGSGTEESVYQKLLQKIERETPGLDVRAVFSAFDDQFLVHRLCRAVDIRWL